FGKEFDRAINNGFQLRIFATEDNAAPVAHESRADEQFGFAAACCTAVKYDIRAAFKRLRLRAGNRHPDRRQRFGGHGRNLKHNYGENYPRFSISICAARRITRGDTPAMSQTAIKLFLLCSSQRSAAS